jgi:aspartate aminotransferase
MIQRVVDRNLQLTFLEQRLNYTRAHPEREWITVVENVPVWPNGLPILPTIGTEPSTHYESCRGNFELIEALCHRENEVHGIAVQNEQVLITNGALHGLSLVFRLLAAPGAIAFCQSPPYRSVTSMLESAGYRVVYFESPADDGDELPQQLASSTSATKLIYVNSPQNPTGQVYSRSYLAKLCRFAKDNGIAVVSDQVYDTFSLSGRQIESPLSCVDEWSNFFAINSVSKNYGMPGLRIGWVVSSEKNISALTGLLEQECVAVCGPAQLAALQMVKHGNAELLLAIKDRHSEMKRLLGNIPGIKYEEPIGGLQYLVKVPVEEIESFADFALLNYGLVLTTTANFSNLRGSFLRFSFAYPGAISERALSLFSQALKEFQFTNQ